jgi:hypothetical protein
MKKFLFVGVVTIFVSCLSVSCDNPRNSQDKPGQRKTDSTEILQVMRTAYKWHETKGRNILDFEILIKDSFQVGIDTMKFKSALSALKNTNYFSADFLKNYEAIGHETDYELKHGKFYNEINFSFQDADPWNGFQDSAGIYWNTWQISDLKINADTASLNWKLGGQYPTEKYLVKFKREDTAWRIAYMQGFDFNSQGFTVHK